ncbi:hypothetical protein IT409_02850 [Candidatus Falkowbacteria bacterium]|nr:hypothetical protein [Candidatus Falkowbacteria bacterium]
MYSLLGRHERLVIERARKKGYKEELEAIFSFTPQPQGKELLDNLFKHYNSRKKRFEFSHVSIHVDEFINQLMELVRIRGFESVQPKVRELITVRQRDFVRSQQRGRDATQGAGAYLL